MNTKRPSNRIVSFALGALLATALPLAAQQPSPAAAPQPTFDVVSIRENKSDSGGAMNFRPTADGFTATNVTIDFLLGIAYDFRNDQIFGLPKWTDSVHFDIKAKITGRDKDGLKELSQQQRQAMYAAVLADYFHLRAHVETRTLPVTIS